ncbi:MAG: hypothetical protein LLF94_01370 [Chlamydiales bacterium]|nr:hypothetical protein [Chlamydiales bacterium]
MSLSLIAGVSSCVASVVTTVMTPVCEVWHQHAVTQTGLQCQNITNATVVAHACWKAGALVSGSGVVSRLFGIVAPTLTGVSVWLIANKAIRNISCLDITNQNDSEDVFYCKIRVNIAAISATAVASIGAYVASVVTSSSAEEAAFSIGYECLNKSIVNETACMLFKNSLETYNDIAGICWVAGTVATVGAAFLLGGCAPEHKQPYQQVEGIDFDEL